jgi:AraC family transcriptional regulator
MLNFSKIGQYSPILLNYFCHEVFKQSGKVNSVTTKSYHERVNRIVLYINNNLSEELDIEKLAALGNYSAFHFHRIMRAFLGEPLGAYINRLRLEASVHLLKMTELPINEIAFKVGYDSPSSFNKAFKKRYDVSPGEYRENTSRFLELNRATFQLNAMKYLKNLTPKIRIVPARKLIYTQATGNYGQSSKTAWDRICSYAAANRLFGFRTEFIGISYDDPKVTEAEKLRYDACLTVSKTIKPEGEIGYKEIPEGRYAIFTHAGPYENFQDSYDYIFGHWVPDNNAELRDEPCFEKYLNSPDKTKPEKLMTEIYIPVK